MSRATADLSKITGVAGLGILTVTIPPHNTHPPLPPHPPRLSPSHARSLADPSTQGATSVLALICHPSLTSLPALTPAPSFRAVQHALEARLAALTRASAATLVVAWALSPRGARHPYLLWTALPPLGVVGWAWWGRRREQQQRVGARGAGAKGSSARGGNGGEAGSEAGSESDEGWERDVAASGVVGPGGRAEVNGEMVREEIEAWGRGMQWRSSVYAVGMLSGLLGLLGDVL